MSPTPPTNDPNFAATIEDFKHGGWVVSILGGAGMLARLLIDNENHPILFWVKRIIAGSIVGIVCYFALHGTEMSGIHKSIIMSTAGAFSPELVVYLKNKFRKGEFDEKGKGKRRASSKPRKG